MDQVTATSKTRPARTGRTAAGAMVLVAIGLGVWSGADRTQAPPASGATLSRPGTPSTRPTLTVGTYNIRGGRGMDDRADLTRTALVMKNIDVVGLNEIHGGRGPDNTTTLGQLLDRPSLFAPTERRWWADSFGNGLLCALPVEGWLRIPLISTRGAGYRCVLLTRVKWNDKIVTVLLTHIDRRVDREKQLDAVFSLFESTAPPAVLMGDLNTPREDPRLQKLIASGATDALRDTLKDKDPVGRIEWILTRGLRVRDAGLIDHGASDHPFVWAELE